VLEASDPVVVSLGKYPDMGSKPVLVPTSDMPEPTITINVRRRIIEVFIQLWKPRVFRIPSRFWRLPLDDFWPQAWISLISSPGNIWVSGSKVRG
jgi:hypothetical protein